MYPGVDDRRTAAISGFRREITQRGLKPISTAAPGVRISEKFPKLAAEMKDVTLLRGMRTADSNHATARYLMHTGFRKARMV